MIDWGSENCRAPNLRDFLFSYPLEEEWGQCFLCICFFGCGNLSRCWGNHFSTFDRVVHASFLF